MAAETTSKLGSLTKEQLQQAIDKTREEVHIPEGKVVLVTEDLYKDVVKFAQEQYVPDEPIAIALNCTTSESVPDWELLWMSMLRCNLSLALINEDTGEILGMRIAGIGRANEKYHPEVYKHAGFQNMFVLCQHCDEGAKYYEHFGAEESVHFFGLATAASLRHHHIATQLMAAAVTFVKNIGIIANIDPIFIKGESSGKYSKKCYELNGFERLYEQNYADFKINGKQLICNTGEHTSLNVFGMRVSIK